jgi:hypothetical protein
VLFADVVHSDIAAAVGAERLREIMTERPACLYREALGCRGHSFDPATADQPNFDAE